MWTFVGGPELPCAARSWESDGLIGRKQESAVLRRLLTGHRLVSVVGPAGVGKSRLAATTVAQSMPNGPWESLVQVRCHGKGAAGPGVLAAELARVLGVQPSDSRGADLKKVVHALRAAPTLLFLDDVDPVRPECTGLVQQLLMAAPELRVLVTSRPALGLGDEHVLSLAPLSTDAQDTARGHGPAVELFLRRARAAEGSHATAADLDHVRAICRRLEGLPLAIELAAEQTARYSVRDLARRIERRQGWLGSPHRPLRRHRSLRDAIGATYVLCEPALRTVWGRISLLEGPFTEGTAVLMSSGGRVDSARVPACLTQLAAVGVLRCLDDPGGPVHPRYRMTRAARDFGVERLRQAGEFPVAAERRVVHCRAVACVAENLWNTGCRPQALWLAREQLDDLAATVQYAVEHGNQTEAVLEAVTNLWFLWAVYDRADEGLGHLLRLIPRCAADDPVTARGLWLAARLTVTSEPRAAAALLGRAWPSAGLAGDDALVGRIAHVQGLLALREHDAEGAAEHFLEAARTIPAGAPGGPSPAAGYAALALAQAAFAPRAARRSARRAAALAAACGDTWGSELARYAIAFVDHQLGHAGRAWKRAQRILAGPDADLPAPHVTTAVRRLIRDIEAGAPERVPSASTRTVNTHAGAGLMAMASGPVHSGELAVD
jgi:predicted ATPase